MRPLKLIITGFCSYSNRTEIDLEKLGRSGLYLITGKTGSGKTTIFDAITYALYGEPSGINRQASMLRSSFAGPDLPTEVELTFELKEKIYHIKRNPTYERRTKKGDGFTTEAANVYLTMPDGKCLEGAKTVDKKVIELLGIDRTQFSQIVMLAQGDFQKLLSENTVARQAVFRKIFKTDNYQILQKRLSEAQKELYIQVQNISRDLNLYFQNTQCHKDNVLSLELEKAKTTEISWEEKIHLLERIIKDDEELQKKLTAESEENQKKLDEVNVELSDAQDFINTKGEFEKKNTEITLQLKALELLKEQFNEAEKNQETISEKEKAKTLIENDLEKYDALENLSLQLKTLEKEIAESQTAIRTLESKQEGLENLKNKMQQELGELEEKGDRRSELSLKEKDLGTKQSDLVELKKSLKDYGELEGKLATAQKEYSAASEKAMASQMEYQQKNKAFLDGQAGILAENLKENEPCPVCGALHHPAPAQKTLFVPTEEELNKAKADADELSKLAEEKSRNASVLNGQAEAQKTAAEKTLEKYFTGIEIKDGLQAVAEEIEKLNGELSEVKALLEEEALCHEKIEDLKKRIPEVQDSLAEGEKKLAAAQNKLSVDSKSMELVGKQRDEAKEKLQFETKALAEAACRTLSQEIEGLRKAYESAQNALHNGELKLSELKASAGELEKRLSNAKVFDAEELNDRRMKLEEKAAGLSEGLKQVFARIQTNRKAVENIRPNSSELIEKQKKLQLVTELSNTANGTLGQKKAKVMLETYVQMHYFDRIIAHANKRFMIMSGGQYELVRKVEADNAQSQSGLELNVIDHYKGAQRDVKSLSGGESFEASLSLALGLSDEIAENAGGIRIDTMFVDEGFGTLDGDTLQKAYNALVSITEGNRLVGIISHVDYLKEKIDRQLVVEKEPESGSSVTITV